MYFIWNLLIGEHSAQPLQCRPGIVRLDISQEAFLMNEDKVAQAVSPARFL